MSRFSRFTTYTLAFLAGPVLSAAVAVRALSVPDPELPAKLDASTVAAIPRPAIDPAKPTVVVLLGADLTEITDALGPYEMFARAAKYNVVVAAPARQPTLLTGGLRILPHYSLAEIDTVLGAAPAVVVIPNLPNAAEAMNRPVIEWIRKQAAAGSLIHSWCTGAMALAETGLLDGQTATAHWGDIPTLEKRYPRVTWVRGVRWIDRGQYVMSAGITSGIDASLRVLIRTAGDSVARRVAREIRYPNYHFALDPRAEQFSLQPADFILLANAAFRFNRARVGVGIYDGVGEIDLSNVYDAHAQVMVNRVETVADTDRAIVTAHGLTLFPSLSVATEGLTSLRELDRLMIPGPEAPREAAALVGRLRRAVPALRPEYIHAAQPDRFGLETVIEDLARVSDRPTARFALKRMEYRSAAIRLEGSAIPWVPLSIALGLGLAGLSLAAALTATVHRNSAQAIDTRRFSAVGGAPS
jgi:putative intracellular protease/amidase